MSGTCLHSVVWQSPIISWRHCRIANSKPGLSWLPIEFKGRITEIKAPVLAKACQTTERQKHQAHCHFFNLQHMPHARVRAGIGGACSIWIRITLEGKMAESGANIRSWISANNSCCNFKWFNSHISRLCPARNSISPRSVRYPQSSIRWVNKFSLQTVRMEFKKFQVFRP